jgi:phenylacetate-coenzyme A ligase PaaK-like adenylate-forming protein
VYRENETDLEMVWSQYRSRAIWDVGVFDKRALLWGHATSLNPGRGHKLKQFSVDLMLNRVRFSAYKLGSADLQRYLAKMTEFKPAQLYGYSNATHLLAMEALKSGYTKPDSLRLVTLTSERVTEAVREAVQRTFETNVTEEYGAAECLVIAYEDRQHRLRIREDNVMVETLPVGDGYCKIVISVLCNPSFPLLRYDIGDLAERPVTETSVGFSLLGPIYGKANDFLISASGRRVRSGVLSGLHHYPIRCFSAHQFSDGKVLLLLVPDHSTNIDLCNIQRKVSALLDGQEVEVRLSVSIPLTSAGKHKVVSSDITNPPPS